MPLLELTDIHRRYGSVHALRGVSLTLEPGTIGLVGNNGAGKSTLIKILLGLLQPDSGHGQILGVDLAAAGRSLRSRLGYMAEAASTVPILKGVEYVTLSGDLYNMPHRQAKRRAHEVLEYVGLGEMRYRRLEEYSVGNLQRLKLAAALVHDPELLLLDEPTSGLDPRGRESFLRLLADLVLETGKSLLLSTHLLGDIERLCQQVVVLEAGQVRHSGPRSEFPTPATERYYLSWDGDGSQLVAALQQAGLNVEPERRRPGALVTAPAEFTTRQFFLLARESGVLVRELRREEADLERTFFRLTEGTRSHAR